MHLSEIPSFRDHDLFSQVHYLWEESLRATESIKNNETQWKD